MIRLKPEVLDKARELTGSRSDEQLGATFLYLTGATIRNYRDGKTTPTIVTLARLREITGIPLDNMLTERADGTTTAA